MPKKLKDKVCIITGATGGMGRAISKTFAASGGFLILSGRNKEKGIALEKELRNSIFIQGDVSNAHHNKTLVQAAVSNFGRLDILSINAGILGLGNVVDLPI